MKKRPAIKRLFIANRGEIALLVARTAKRLKLEVASAFSRVDGGMPHLRLCDFARELEGEPARVYLDIGKIVDAARELGADAVHPGYGFLSENEQFAAAVEDAGMRFVGPAPDQIEKLGDKLRARAQAALAGVPCVPGKVGAVKTLDEAREAAALSGYPLIIKAANGGGGRGMRVINLESELAMGLERSEAEARASFGDSRLFIEKYIPAARHVEVQIVGDGAGRAIALGERECSVQRRHQKLIEESPAPALTPQRAAEMQALAAKLAASVNYRGAGTMEFIVPRGTQDFYFIEMNTRLQVEHPVTEARTGLDLVAEQLSVAEHGCFSEHLEAQLGAMATGVATRLNGHAIEARIVAEDPRNGFQPSVGELSAVCFPGGAGIRVDAWAEAGLDGQRSFTISLLGKVIAWGHDARRSAHAVDHSSWRNADRAGEDQRRLPGERA